MVIATGRNPKSFLISIMTDYNTREACYNTLKSSDITIPLALKVFLLLVSRRASH